MILRFGKDLITYAYHADLRNFLVNIHTLLFEKKIFVYKYSNFLDCPACKISNIQKTSNVSNLLQAYLHDSINQHNGRVLMYS